ncbi:hypothetical protein WK39_03050 [Burkholderia cepacia]|uniref:hypothetical protein n=1 Tax=Burkholderia cepacia TaxID=292 RepID=UPI0007569E68|nr:hypothetical protein [Burkholderia cepacia]KVS53269.1 hypothetical protein WK39_03050 [Burkholderia cepacia]KVS57733.1 hypothetical protein WK40_25500 [Burkholderia cepacia]CAG9268965.1 conserved hypothetical protein [Burkholderia cepacia]
MAKLRCRPGDLARVVHSVIPGVVGRSVLIERFNGERESWDVTILGDPVFGIGFRTKRPMVTNRLYFRDSSLVPLRGEPLADEESTGRATTLPQPV